MIVHRLASATLLAAGALGVIACTAPVATTTASAPATPPTDRTAPDRTAARPAGPGPVVLTRPGAQAVAVEDRCGLLGRVEPIDRHTCVRLGGREVLVRTAP